jgi:nucleotide-binding universal stress UspA family protein
LEDFQQDLRRELASAGLNHHGVTPLLLTKPHAEQLAELALIRKSDLVVIGHGHQLMEWSAIRSGTIPRLLAEAPCPVLILPANPPEPR